MYAETLAILASVSFAASAVLLKRGYVHASPLSSALVILVVNVVLLWGAVFALGQPVVVASLPWFIAAGLLGQGLARTLRYYSIHKTGPTRTYILIATIPIYSAVLAVLFLGEQLTLPIVAGTGLIIAGVIALAGEPQKTLREKRYLLLPLLAAVAYGVMSIFQKQGLLLSGMAISGAAVALSSALVGVAFYALFQRGAVFPGKSFGHFFVAGLFSTVAMALNFEALRAGAVTLVIPLIDTQPLFVMLFSFLFLKKHEQFGKHAVVGGILVVAGAAVITAL
jgi:drug/metabolite transporter, DME family